jgi:hypothetical protein
MHRTTMYCRICAWVLIAQLFVCVAKGQDFSAVVHDTYVLLQWKFPQKQADHFEIQRRSRGGEFKTISLILSDDADSVLYKYKDKFTGAETHYYYRIKIFYANGTEEYSDILSVAINSVQQESVMIVPGSAAGTFIPGLPVAKGSYLLRVYDMNGRLLLTQRSPAARPELLLDKLAKGNYFMEAYHPQTGKRFYGTFSQ